MTGKELLDCLEAEDISAKAAEQFTLLYGEYGFETARQRYAHLIEGLLTDSPSGFPLHDFPETAGEVRLFSAPGRTELGGNHTDHNNGKVLAASVQLDAAAAVAPRKDKRVIFRSSGHRDVILDLSDLSAREEEKGETEALIRGIAAEFAAQGTPVCGFTANAASSVLTGSGLSSSAAIEVLVAKIFDNLFCGGKRKALDLARIGQKAENVYFGKPSGLMDQISCASGGTVAVDFKNSQSPLLKELSFDPTAAGFALCVVNTGSSHADLAVEYAAIPAEMKKAAAFFGKDVLGELDEKTLLDGISKLRKAEGDRAVLRAFHFFAENRRVNSMLGAIEKMNSLPRQKKGCIMEEFLALVRESGDSSWELLQNIYPPDKPAEQGLALALVLTKNFLNGVTPNGACRVHGGGFAGTIQAYLPLAALNDYRNLMEGIFGRGALTVLKIRPRGAVELFL